MVTSVSVSLVLSSAGGIAGSVVAAKIANIHLGAVDVVRPHRLIPVDHQPCHGRVLRLRLSGVHPPRQATVVVALSGAGVHVRTRLHVGNQTCRHEGFVRSTNCRSTGPRPKMAITAASA